MDLINTTDIQANETNVNWYENGEAANADVLNRPTKQVAEVVNDVITKLQDNEVSVGLNAGQTNQGINAIAIGENAGQTNQGINAIAIGENAGQTNQPANTIAIGENATPANEGDIVIKTTSNTIEVNADGMTMNSYRGGNISLDGNANFGGTLSEKGQRVYSPNNKPTAATVGAVPTSRTVNGKPLTTNITLSATDVGARPSSWTPTVSDVGAVPTSRTVNGKALSTNISLSAADVGAVPTSRTVNGKALSTNISLSATDVGARANTWLPTVTEIGAVSNTDSRLTNSREWMAATITQAEAEAGTATTRRAFTAQRVRQAIVAWFNGISGALGRTILTRTTAAQVRGDIDLGTAATADVTQTTGTSTTGVMSQKAVTDQLATKAALSHTHTWSQVTGQPSTATRWPTFAEVTGKPSTYTPSAHTHTAAQVSGLGTAATATITTSNTDGTTGRVLKVGDGGWMSRGVPQSTSYNYPTSINDVNNQTKVIQTSIRDNGLVYEYSSGIHFSAGDTWGRLRVSPNGDGAWVQGGNASNGTGWTTTIILSSNLQQTTGNSTSLAMSQKAVTDAINSSSGTIPTNAGGVGTYMLGRTSSTPSTGISFGQTIPGSLIYPTSVSNTGGAAYKSGTWRCMGQSSTMAGGTHGTLYIRIS